MSSIRPAALASMLGLLVAACGSASTTAQPSGTLVVAPQNNALVVGVNRVSVALLDAQKQPINGATGTTLDIEGAHGVFETRHLEYVGTQYGKVPLYVGAALFAQAGQYQVTVRTTLPNGRNDSGQAFITVADHGPEIPVGAHLSPLHQPIATDPGVKITDIDSGVPPDPWHTATIADGLAQRRAMVLYFGEPGFCKSRTCGPTVQVLQDVCTQYCDRLIFEHIENNYPAGPDESSKRNPAFEAFGLQSEPWIYFVNASGVVTDRFEGPATAGQLREAAEGTLQGHVPAVAVRLGN